MKTILVLTIAFAIHAHAADALTERLQRGLFEEEANRNLDAAIKEYQAVVAQSDEQRKVIATALFRLGECYRKLGKTNEAAAFYQRITRDFSEQEQLVRLSRELLPHPSAGTSSAVPVMDAAAVKLLREEVQVAEQIIKGEENKLAAGKGALSWVLDAKKEALRLKRLLPEHSSPAQQRALIEGQIGIVDQLLKEYERRIQVGTVAPFEHLPIQRELLSLQRELTTVSDVAKSLAGETPAISSMTQAETEELARVETLARNSPDLLRGTSANGGQSELQSAALKGYASVVEFLLTQGVGPNDPVSGNSPLVLAALRGNLRIVQLLLDQGSSKDDAGKALINACEAGFKSVAELLIARGADVNHRTGLNLTPLHFAAYGGHAAIVELLLKQGARPDVLSTGNNAPKGWPQWSVRGATPLHLAVGQSYAIVAAQLINAGAKAGASNSESRTPLHLAAASGNTNLCALLLDHGANPNAATTVGDTVLSLAIGGGRLTAVSELLRRGAEVNLEHSLIVGGKDAPVIQAVRQGVPDVLTALLTAKPNLEVTNQSGQTALEMAVSFKRDDIAEQLLEAGANPNHLTTIGWPLLLHAIDGRPRVVDALLRHGANPNVVKNGRTPLSVVLSALNGPTPGSPGMMPPAGQRPPDRKAELGQMAASLRQHGADEFLQRRGFISAVRGQEQRVNIFSKGTNNMNRYTLMEFLAAVYEQRGDDFPFPDFAKITIHRLDAKTEKLIPVDAAKLLANTNCAGDILLEWGDYVEIPMADHPVNSKWYGLQESGIVLWDCLQRRVQFRAGATNIALTFSFRASRIPEAFLPGFQPSARSPFFRLSNLVLRDNRFRNLIRSSSDLSRVTVTRTDPQTKETRKMTFDLNAVALPDMSYSGSAPPIPWAHDLWLRDGDVIEVPEKP